MDSHRWGGGGGSDLAATTPASQIPARALHRGVRELEVSGVGSLRINLRRKGEWRSCLGGGWRGGGHGGEKQSGARVLPGREKEEGTVALLHGGGVPWEVRNVCKQRVREIGLGELRLPF